MKHFLKSQIVRVLGWQVRRLRRKFPVKIVAVAGSIGKTSTKLAIATVLSQSFRVRYQDGNYNDLVSVPLIFFGESMPSLLNPFAWLGIFLRNERQLKRNYPFDVVVVEIGTDGPGQVAAFSKYIHADIAVMTAIAPEHMEFFHDLQSVAAEEFAIRKYADKLLVNADLCDESFLSAIDTAVITYGKNKPSDYTVSTQADTADTQQIDISHSSTEVVTVRHTTSAEPQLYSICASAAVATEMGMSSTAIAAGIQALRPVSGRMQRLRGVNDSIIIDDTYNASPEAVKAALDVLYRIDAPQRIAILGNMNELGAFSETAHTQIGEYCDPDRLALVVTIGKDANAFTAPAAERKGCRVTQCIDPYSAAEYIMHLIQQGAVILAKGSQNGVFAEEAVKLLLADKQDADKLVRQSPAWLRKKQEAFKRGQ